MHVLCLCVSPLRHSRPVRVLFIAVAVFLVLPQAVFAAALTYSSDTTIQLTDPSVQFIIKSGSGATSLDVNATSVIAAIPAGTTFILTSASRNLSISPGIEQYTNLSCSGGVAALTLTTQTVVDQTLTITPGSAQCSSGSASPSTPPLSGSGGGGGGSGYSMPSPSIAPTLTPALSPVLPATSQQEQALSALIAQLQVLLSRAKEQGISLPPGSEAFLAPGSEEAVFSSTARDLMLGMRGDDIKKLQFFLIGKAAGQSAKDLASVGATGYFGQLTRAALAEFQKNVGITPAAGYFGPKTRAYIDALNK